MMFSFNYIEVQAGSIRAGVEMVLESHKSVDTILMGCRRTDPGMASSSYNSKSDNGYPRFTRIFPLLDWNNSMIWSFIFENSLKFPTLYHSGYSSIGTKSNTKINPKLITGDTILPAWELTSDESDRFGRS